MTTQTAVDTLAKVDLCLHFEGALPVETLNRLAAAQDRTWDAAAVTDLATLADARRLVRDIVRDEDALFEAALDLGRRLCAATVVHVELVVDPTGWPQLAPADVLGAIDRGLMQAVTEEEEERFLSWVLLPALPRQLTTDDALVLIDGVLDADLDRLGGVLVLGDDEKSHGAMHLQSVLERVREAGMEREIKLGRVVTAGDLGGKERVAEALAMGVERVVGGTAALKDPATLLQLRAHRTPVLLQPSWQVLAGVAKSMATHPLRKWKEAGVFTVLGSGWPELMATSMAAELEQLSKHHHWRLDDMRNASTRGIEAAFMAPNLRFHLARRIEVWRHRPLAGPPNKTDNWSL
jgi:adenosine deaminase